MCVMIATSTSRQIVSWFLSPVCAGLAIVMACQITENQERRILTVEREERIAAGKSEREESKSIPNR